MVTALKRAPFAPDHPSLQCYEKRKELDDKVLKQDIHQSPTRHLLQDL